MKPYIKGQYYMITTTPQCDNYFLVVAECISVRQILVFY